MNIAAYRWIADGRDYAGLVTHGVVNDGCPFAGRLAVLGNFLAHGAQTLWEEILFRGFLAVPLAAAFGAAPAILGPAALFGLAHFLPFRAYAVRHGIAPGRYVWGALVLTSALPAAFTAVNLSLGSIVPGWIMHWTLNCSVGLYLRYAKPALLRRRNAPNAG